MLGESYIWGQVERERETRGVYAALGQDIVAQHF